MPDAMLTIKGDEVTIISNLVIRIRDMRQRMTDPKFTFDRNGLRLAIASIDDENNELWEEWNRYKRNLGNGVEKIRHELLDIAGIAMLAYERTFDNENV